MGRVPKEAAPDVIELKQQRNHSAQSGGAIEDETWGFGGGVLVGSGGGRRLLGWRRWGVIIRIVLIINILRWLIVRRRLFVWAGIIGEQRRIVVIQFIFFAGLWFLQHRIWVFFVRFLGRQQFIRRLQQRRADVRAAGPAVPAAGRGIVLL